MALPDTTSDLVTVTTPHGTVRLRDTGGPGTPVLLVHALLADPDLYASLVPLLVAQGRRCLVPELPMGGHGVPLDAGADLTPPGLADLLAEILDAVGVERAHVVGVDTGGALAQLLMAGHRDRVDRVVLTACDAYDAFPPRLFAPLAAGLRSRVFLRVLAVGGRSKLVRRSAAPRPVTHRGVDDATLLRWALPLRRPEVRRDLRKVALDMHRRHTLAAAETNRDFPRPVLVAWGDDARLFPRRLADQLVADLPHATLETIEDCAAFASVDQPATLARLIDEHLTLAAAPAG